jgi:hypothetical protein
MLCPLEETTFWDTRLYLELPYDYRCCGHGLHASLLLKVFSLRISRRDSFKGEGCNTPGVYIPLDNEYGIKHVISVGKRMLNFKHLRLSRFYIASVSSVASATLFLSLSIRACPKFSCCSEHICSENRCVRWLIKIHRRVNPNSEARPPFTPFYPGQINLNSTTKIHSAK